MKIFPIFFIFLIHKWFQLHHGNVIPLLISILNGIFAFATVFIACELGQRMYNAFEKIDFNIEQLKWYLFPSKIKRLLPMIIAAAQEPVEMECFGSMTCTREVFEKVSTKVQFNKILKLMCSSQYYFIFPFRWFIALFRILWCCVNLEIENIFSKPRSRVFMYIQLHKS